MTISGLDRIDGRDGHPADKPFQRGLLDLQLAESGQDGGDVAEERLVRSEDQHTGAPKPLAVQVQQVRGPVQAHRSLSCSWRPLHADRGVEVSANQLVLLGLDRGDDVAHRPDARALDLRNKDFARGAEFLAPVEALVLEARQVAAGEPEPPPRLHALRVAGAGLVEGPADRGPPVQHQRIAELVGDVPTSDVKPSGQWLVRGHQSAIEVEAAEEQRRTGVVGEFGHPPGQRDTKGLGGEGVTGDLRADGVHGFGVQAHRVQGRPRRGHVCSFGFEFGVEIDKHDGGSSGSTCDLAARLTRRRRYRLCLGAARARTNRPA